MAFNFMNRIKQGVSDVKKTVAGASETVSNYRAAAKSDDISRQNIKNIAIVNAKKDFAVKYPGQTMSTNRLQTEATAGGFSKPTKDYLKTRDSIEKKKLKQYDL